MRQEQTTVLTGTFVIYHGWEKPTEFTTGQFVSYPREVQSRDPDSAAKSALRGTVYFYFVDLRLFPDDAAQYFHEGILKRFVSCQEVLDRSPKFFPDCVRLTPNQAFPNFMGPLDVLRGLQIPVNGVSRCGSNESDVRLNGHIAVLGSDGRGYVLKPEDVVLSERAPRPGEFRAA